MIELKYGMIVGGRAGDGYQSGMITIPTDADALEEMIEVGDVIDITPNDSDLQTVLDVVERNELFCDWDVYGEGVFALSTSASNEELELAVRRKYDEDED